MMNFIMIMLVFGPFGEKKERKCSFFINATIDRYNPSLGDVTFVFRVRAELGGETTYDNVIPITFNNVGTRRVKVDGIPVGSNCTTTVCYYASYFNNYEEELKNLDPDTNPIPEVNFNFDYEDLLYKTKSLTNHFIYDNYGWIKGNGNVESSIIDSNGEIVNDLKTEAPDIAIHETTEEGVRNITVENIGDKPAYVRVVILNSDVVIFPGSYGWFNDPGEFNYWYYGGILQPGDSTEVFRYELDLPRYDIVVGQGEYNVVVIVESAIVSLNSSGDPNPAGGGNDGWYWHSYEERDFLR